MKTKITIDLEVTEAQGLALQAMFEYWEHLSNIGASRFVAFYVDGDGDFHPKSKISFSDEITLLTDEMRKIAVVSDDDGNRKYDYDGIDWLLDK